MIAKEAGSCSAIVCAYNEEHTLKGVLQVLLDSPLVDDIIAIDDGSTDGTAAVMQTFVELSEVHAIFLPQNRGKGFAMTEGIMQTQGEVLLFVDADLLNLRPSHIARVMDGILNGTADMVIGYPSRGQGLMSVNLFRPLSGQRAVIRKDILPLVEILKTSRYGVETLINLHYRRESKRVLYVPLQGLFHPMKVERVGPKNALGLYAREASQIAQSVIRHYPLTIAALGFDLTTPQHWWERISMNVGGARFSRLSRQSYRRAIRHWSERRVSMDAIPDRKEGMACGKGRGKAG